MNPTRTIMSFLARLSPPHMFLLIFGLAAGTTLIVGHEINKAHTATNNVPPAPAPRVTQKILVCAKDIAEGATITSDDLTLLDVDSSKAPIDCLSDQTLAIGHSSKFALVAGNPLSMHDLAPLAAEVGFQAKLRAGERAITMGVDNNTGVAGFITPDSHVDVMVQVGSGAETKTRAILSDVRVVAAGTTYIKQRGDSTAQPVSNVTVAVTPEESGKLINAMTAGRIYLTLRNDRDHVPVAVTDVNSLFAKPKTHEIADVLPMPMPPPVIPSASTSDQPPQSVAQALPNPLHEVEQWQGSKRDVASVNRQ